MAAPAFYLLLARGLAFLRLEGRALMEGGKGSKVLAVHFQLRPDPLAK